MLLARVLGVSGAAAVASERASGSVFGCHAILFTTELFACVRSNQPTGIAVVRHLGWVPEHVGEGDDVVGQSAAKSLSLSFPISPFLRW